MTTIMPHPFRVAIILLVVFLVGGCMSSTPTRNYSATAVTPSPSVTTIPVAPASNGGVEVTVQGVSRSSDPGYRLPHPGYIQFDVTVRNTGTSPIQFSDAQLTAGGSTSRYLYTTEIVPIQDNSLAVGGIGVGSVLMGSPIGEILASTVNRVVGTMDQNRRNSLKDMMLQHSSIPPGTAAVGIVVFRDNGQAAELLSVNYVDGASGFAQKSVSVPLKKGQEVAVATP